MKSSSLEPLFKVIQIGLHLGPDIGVGDDRRYALEFPILLREFMRRRDEGLRQLFLYNLFYPFLMICVAIGMQQKDRNGFYALFSQGTGGVARRPLIQFAMDGAVRPQPFLNLETKRTRDQGIMLLEIQIIGVWPVDSTNFIDVAEALSDQQSGFRPGALQQCIDDNG